MIKYKLSNTENGEILGQFKTRQDAADAMNQYIAETNDGLDPSDEEWLTPFDFDLEEVEVKEAPNEIIVDYNSAREYLGGKANKQFTVSQRVASMNTVPGLMDVTRLVDALNPSHVEALIALNELFTIAQAWNKADDFVPDYSDRRQDKWFPWFVYDKDRAGFVSANSVLYAVVYVCVYRFSALLQKRKSRPSIRRTIHRPLEQGSFVLIAAVSYYKTKQVWNEHLEATLKTRLPAVNSLRTTAMPLWIRVT